MSLLRWFWAWLNKPKRRLAVIAVLLFGCVHVGITPDLPFPQAPGLQFVPVQGNICLDEAQANNLALYLEELHAYRQAVHRLHRAP